MDNQVLRIALFSTRVHVTTLLLYPAPVYSDVARETIRGWRGRGHEARKVKELDGRRLVFRLGASKNSATAPRDRFACAPRSSRARARVIDIRT